MKYLIVVAHPDDEVQDAFYVERFQIWKTEIYK